MTSGSFGGRLGLVWESSELSRGKRSYVVRVVHKGTRLKSPMLASLPDPAALAWLVVWVPIRALLLLVYRDSFKVALIEVNAYPDDERIVERHAIHGGAEALAVAQRLAAEHMSQDREDA